MTKIVSLSDDAYEMLKLMKKPGESFSKVIRRIVKKEKKSLLKFEGAWHGSKEELDKIFKDIFEKRHKSKSREVSF